MFDQMTINELDAEILRLRRLADAAPPEERDRLMRMREVARAQLERRIAELNSPARRATVPRQVVAVPGIAPATVVNGKKVS